MKSKCLSLLLTVVLLLPTAIETFFYFSDHQHEICNEDGIHFHENLPDCHLCLLNKISSEDFLYSDYDLFITSIINDNYNSNSFSFLENFLFNPLNRGPPSNIS